jgi:hypothetical protein
MKRRVGGGGERSDSTVLVAALLGIIIGSSASLWTQSASAAQVCAPAACTTCPVCPDAARESKSAAVATTEAHPIGGTFRPAGRESLGNAELQKVLARIAINDEVLVAGVCPGPLLGAP